MSGISSAISPRITGPFLDIVLDKDGYSIGWSKFAKSASTDTLLPDCAKQTLDIFRVIKRVINQTQNIDLTQDLCHQLLTELARQGRRAYQEFFSNEAQDLLKSRFQLMGKDTPAPTFISEQLLFPWEVLYEGDDYRIGDPKQFWGLRYSPARILDRKDVSKYAREQDLPSDMLFCLHHKLVAAHQQEWPAIERLVKLTHQDRFYLLGALEGYDEIQNGEAFLEYLYQADHNMVHFACHCRRWDTSSDALLVSLINKNSNANNPPVIELASGTFLDIPGFFRRQPLVFLNACQSAGGTDEIRNTFNLPKVFVKSGAAAVVATACPVHDLFAAAFARHFYEYFLGKHMTIGEALRETRLHFLRVHNNPLGLAYGLYSPAHYQLAWSPAAGVRQYEY